MTYLPPANGGRVNLTIGGNTAGAGSLVSSGTATLVGGNNITLSQNGNAITISGGAGGAAGSNTFGMSNLGNTSGTTGVLSGSALQYALAGGNNVTLSQSLNGVSGTLTISAANQSVQTQNLHNVTLSGNTAGVMAQISSGTLTLAGGNNVTLSQNGNAVTISAGAGGGGGGIALANSQTTYSSGTANLIEGGGAITINSTTGQSFKFSVPQISSLSATGAVSISTNGGTISIGAPIIPSATLSRFDYPNGIFTALSANGQGSLSLNHVYVPFNVTGSAMKIGGSLTLGTSTAASTGSANLSLWMGIYSLNGSSLSLASSGSTLHAFSWQAASTATSALTSLTGMRELTVPMNVNMTPGEYWAAAVISSATTATGATFSVWGNNLLGTAAGQGVLTPLGSATSNANSGAMMLQGIYTAATSAGPSSVAASQINNSSAGYAMRANFYNVIYNASY